MRSKICEIINKLEKRPDGACSQYADSQRRELVSFDIKARMGDVDKTMLNQINARVLAHKSEMDLEEQVFYINVYNELQDVLFRLNAGEKY